MKSILKKLLVVFAFTCFAFFSLSNLLAETPKGWGDNEYGQLGTGRNIEELAPVQPLLPSDVSLKAIACGADHTLAVDSDGRLWVWGRNNYGQLGIDSKSDIFSPVSINNFDNATAVSAGVSHSLALKSDGTVWAFGSNWFGQLGNEKINSSLTPIQVQLLDKVIAISAGYYHSLALKSDGTVWAFGYNEYGQLGNGTTISASKPVQVQGLSSVVAIAAGSSHSLALKSDGTLWAWGDNRFGQLGNGTFEASAVPIQVTGISSVKEIACGGFHSLAIINDGSVFAWGDNSEGQLGDGTYNDSPIPVKVIAEGMRTIAAGLYSSFAVDENGEVWGWGNNEKGQLGNIEEPSVVKPTHISNLSRIVRVYAGRAHSIAEACPVISLSPAALANGVVGVSYSQTISASGGTAPYSYTVTSGSLPAGLNIDGATGVISGTPTTAGNSTFTITATDSNLCTGTKDYTIKICPQITLSPASPLPGGSVGTPYSQTITAAGGTAPYVFSLSSGTLPDGLSLNSSTGEISGTPTIAGNFLFTITATDSNACSGSKSYSIGICAQITLSPNSLPDGTVGATYSQQITAGGGTSPYTFAVTNGALPDGLTLAAGKISGTPTTEGNFTFTITATDAANCTGSKEYTIKICGTITLSPASMPNGTVGTAYSETVSANGGVAPYTYSISSGALPNGLTLNETTGVISGTPTTAKNFSFTIKATDNFLCYGTKSYTITISPASCPTFTFTPATLPNATVNSAYSQTISVTGGTPAYTFSLASGTLPAGITLSSSGSLSGTPTQVGTFNFTVQAVDKNYCTGSKAYTLAVNCAQISLTPASLPDGALGTSYNQTISASGGKAPYSFSISAGSLPPGLSLDSSTGVISGNPTNLGTFNFTVNVVDANFCSGLKDYTIKIVCGTIVLSPSGLASGTVGTAYNQTLSATGGTAPYTFAVTTGSLPPGLTLNTNTGAITGTPTTAGSYTFTTTATDVNSCTGSKQYTIVVAPSSCPTITLSPATLPNGTQGVAYSQTISATGGTSPYAFIVLSGTLPSGLSLSAGGILSGTPTAAGSYNFTIQASDANYCVGTKAYSITIAQACPTITLLPSTLENGTVGTAYTQTITATGGATPYTYAVTSGSLPNGITLNATTGVISGTPTVVGTSEFTITATDHNNCTGSQAYSITVNAACPTITISPATLPNGIVGTTYTPTTISATGGTAPYTYSITSGALPSGLTLNETTGVLSGTPTAVGTYTFSITATDANKCTGVKSYSLVIASNCPTITISPATLQNAIASTYYTQALSVSGGTSPYVFTVSSGTLPDGLSLNSSTGEISGTPTTPGSFNFTIKVTDAKNCSGSKDYSISVIVNPPVIASVKKMSDPPFRLKILGSNFHPGCVVLIDGVEVQTAYKTNYKVIAKKGETLKALLPKGVPVQITVLNKDDGGVSNAVTYVR